MILPSPINKWLNPELILLNNKNHKIQAPWCPSTLQTNFILLQAQPSCSLSHCATLTSQDPCPGSEGCKHLICTATPHLEPAACSHSHPAAPLHALAVISGYSSKLLCLGEPFFLQTQPPELCSCCQAAKNTLPPSLCLSVLFLQLSLHTSPLSVLFSSLWLFIRQENTWRIPEQVLIKPNVLQSKITGKSPASSHQRNPVDLFTEGTIWCFKRSVKIFSCLQSQDDHCNGLTFVTKVSSIFVLLVATVLGWEEGVV